MSDWKVAALFLGAVAAVCVLVVLLGCALDGCAHNRGL